MSKKSVVAVGATAGAAAVLLLLRGAWLRRRRAAAADRPASGGGGARGGFVTAVQQMVEQFADLQFAPGTTVREANERRTASYATKQAEAAARRTLAGSGLAPRALRARRAADLASMTRRHRAGRESHRTVIVLLDADTRALMAAARRQILAAFAHGNGGRALSAALDADLWLPEVGVRGGRCEWSVPRAGAPRGVEEGRLESTRRRWVPRGCTSAARGGGVRISYQRRFRRCVPRVPGEVSELPFGSGCQTCRRRCCEGKRF